MTGQESPLVFLDIETTGLDPARHEVWEIAYAVDDAPIRSAFVTHDVRTADGAAMKLNGYLDRMPSGMYDWEEMGVKFELQLKAGLTGGTIVGANPAFDTKFLRARWGFEPWLYRLIDIESYAMPHLKLDRPRGLAHIAERLGVQAPDHTAAGDVHTLRECWRKLRNAYRENS